MLAFLCCYIRSYPSCAPLSSFSHSLPFSTGMITFLLPCYTAGKNAEAVGQDCMAHAIYTVIPIVNIYFSATIRGKIRDLKGIEVREVNHSISYRDT